MMVVCPVVPPRGTLDLKLPQVKPAVFKAIRVDRGVIADEILRILQGEEIAGMIDVRSKEEYSGLDVWALRGGHIPGTINIDFWKNFNTETFIMLPLIELQEVYNSLKNPTGTTLSTRNLHSLNQKIPERT